MLPQAILWL
ncbi:hypothetical protein YPPY53_2822, partial [Yersinia pestis PY-53]